MEAIFRSGDPVMCDYTPGTAVSAGDVVVVGDLPMVAHLDIGANELGSLASHGGVYEMTAAGNYAPGEAVYWNDTAKKVTQAVGSHKHIGYLTPDSDPAADGDTVRVIHLPNGTATAAS